MHDAHEKDLRILFYKIQIQTNDLLSQLMYEFRMKKDQILQKHLEAESYIKAHSVDVDLSEIKVKINEGIENTPYDISITDENFIIRNTTFKADLGLDLSFANDEYNRHFDQNITGICSPLYETYSKNFMSFTDSFLTKKPDKTGKILLIYYSYFNAKNQLLNLQKLISQYPAIKDVKAYIIEDSGFINDFSLVDYDAYKPDGNSIHERIKNGGLLREKLGEKNYLVESFTREGTQYKTIYSLTTNAIFHDTEFIYNIVFDESEFFTQITRLNLSMFIIAVLGVIAILIIAKIRDKETRLNEQDRFVQSSMHEIKTPLSVITLNNELRELEYGDDEYSKEISSALKSLQNSYDDMSFIVTQEKLNYPIELIDLGKCLRERIDYFEGIARANNKSLLHNINSTCQVEMSSIELNRLIDNNLSNAIKYGDIDSDISITLQENILRFKNSGKAIKDTKKVFKKYFRENNVIGGYGLGLSIISDIAKKYDIHIDLTSTAEKGTTFSYRFKCHTNDTHQE